MKAMFILLAGIASLMPQTHAQNGELPLRPGDRITISVGAIPDNEVSQIRGVYTVSDGVTINLLHIGEVRASGMKPSSLQRSIEQTYISKEIYDNPNVLVSIDSTTDPRRQVTVTGVNKPGEVAYKQDMTLSRAIMSAGGPTPFGSMKKVKLLRAGQAPTIHNLATGLGNPVVDVVVQPDDQIIVPEN